MDNEHSKAASLLPNDLSCNEGKLHELIKKQKEKDSATSNRTEVQAPAKQPAQARRAPEPETDEKPENGLKGLKYWRQDMLAGLVVALVSVPLSLGIAIASGVPPICGITSEIIAGLVFPFLGGAYMTISGPAAGLAPVIMSCMLNLGKGNLEVGYHMILGVIMMAGLLQLLLTYFKCAKFSHLFPNAAIQGMLAAIGVMLFGKQIPQFMGVKFSEHDFFPMMFEIPKHVAQMNHTTMIIGCACVALLFAVNAMKMSWTKFLPPQLVVVIVGAALAKVLQLDPKFLVKVPENPLAHAILFPDFKLLFSDPALIPALIGAVLMLTFVDGTESLATIKAVDRIDPFKRKSNPDRTLFAMGISNICSSLIGGLTIIPGIIKSTTNIVSGGRTAWTNFYNAVFLITFLLAAKELINCIPVAALAAVLVHISYKLAGPHKWKHISAVGLEQLFVFTTTVVVTVLSDLLIGIFVGMGMKLLILVTYTVKSELNAGKALPVAIFSSFIRLFKNPVDHVERRGEVMDIFFAGPLVCFNSLQIRDVCEHLPAEVKHLRLHIAQTVGVVDHSVNLYLQSLQDECKRHSIDFQLFGLEELVTHSDEETALRYRTAA